MACGKTQALFIFRRCIPLSNPQRPFQLIPSRFRSKPQPLNILNSYSLFFLSPRVSRCMCKYHHIKSMYWRETAKIVGGKDVLRRGVRSHFWCFTGRGCDRRELCGTRRSWALTRALGTTRQQMSECWWLMRCCAMQSAPSLPITRKQAPATLGFLIVTTQPNVHYQSRALGPGVYHK